jgi:hypothetical protein
MHRFAPLLYSITLGYCILHFTCLSPWTYSLYHTFYELVHLILCSLNFVEINTPSCYSTENALHPLHIQQPINYICRNDHCYNDESKMCKAVQVP